MFRFLSSWFGPQIEQIEPGVDPMEKPVTPRKAPPWFLIITGAALAILLAVKFVPSAFAAQVPPEAAQAATSTATAIATTTAMATASPTVSPTSALFSALQPVITSNATLAGCSSGGRVEVTRVVYGQCQPSEVTRIVEITREVTTTPLPTFTPYPSLGAQSTQTPWVIVVEVTREVTPTFTPSPTPTETQVSGDPTQTPTILDTLDTTTPQSGT